MALRRNFAYWRPDKQTLPGKHACSQADVFVTVAALLEHLRSGSATPPEGRLVNDAQSQSVLSPENFARFNDGVIQASFLRAALPVELNYAASPEQSHSMAGLILRMTDLHDRPQGEGLCEFLLALRLDRLLLDRPTTLMLRERLRDRAESLPPIARWLAN